MTYIDNEKAKPVVFFDRADNVRIGSKALLWGITNHPLLGDREGVQTSKVVDIRNDGKTIETLNTLYIKMEG